MQPSAGRWNLASACDLTTHIGRLPEVGGAGCRSAQSEHRASEKPGADLRTLHRPLHRLTRTCLGDGGGTSSLAVSKHDKVYPVWLAACNSYDPRTLAAALHPVVHGATERAAGPVCLLVDAPFADSRLAPIATVDPRLVQGLLAALPSTHVTIAARSLPGFPTRYTLQRAGYGPLARSGARLLPLEEADQYRVTAPTSGAILQVPVPYLDSTVRIVVTRLKAAVFPRLSLSGWTLLTLLPDHQRPATVASAAARVADLLEVAPPHLVVVDAIEAGHDGNELTCRPKPMGAIIAGTNALAADLVASAAVQGDLEHLPYLREGARRGLGPGALEAIELRGDLRLDVAREHGAGFTLPPGDPRGIPLPSHVRVVVGEGTSPAGSAGALTVALQVLERAGGFGGARETTMVVGRTQQEQRGRSDQAALVLIGDDASVPYRGFSRVARLRGAPVRVRTLLNDLPLIMRLAKPLDPLLVSMTAAAARSALTQVIRRPRVISQVGGR